MPENLESLDLLMLHVAKAIKVHSDGIHFQGLRYIDVTLAAYVGETVVIRYDPRDLAEIRVFYEDHYLCTAISPEISDYTVDLKDIISARNKRKRSLKNQITPEKTLIEEIIHSKQSQLEAGSEKTEPIKMTHKHLLKRRNISDSQSFVMPVLSINIWEFVMVYLVWGKHCLLDSMHGGITSTSRSTMKKLNF
jgi:hypothetical protein